MNCVRRKKKVRRVAKGGATAQVSAANAELYDFNRIAHPFTNMHVTEKGLDALEEYIGRIRSIIGYKVPLAIDHFRHFPLLDMINNRPQAGAFQPRMAGGYAALATDASNTGCSSNPPPHRWRRGEDMYLAETFEPLLASGALDMASPGHTDFWRYFGNEEAGRPRGKVWDEYGGAHVRKPDCQPCGRTHGHSGAKTSSHWNMIHLIRRGGKALIIGPVKPMVENGFARVTDAPGSGIEALNEDVIREHGPAKGKNVFISTDELE